MPRKPSLTLTPAELRVMKVMWRRRSASASDIVVELARGRAGWKDSTTRTILRILERKGYLRHLRDGRSRVYQVRIEEAQVERGVIRDLVSRFFDDSPERLVLRVLEHEELDAKELARLKRLLDSREKP